MDWNAFLDRLSDRAHPAAIVVSGIGILAGLYALPHWLDRKYAEERLYNRDLSRVLDQTSAAREHVESLEALKGTDLDQLKSGLSGNAMTQKSLFESGLSLQVERRLLDKQLEIITTSLLINPALQRIFLVRADQPVQGFLLSYIPLRSFGGAPEMLPATVRIISKERFAHPERGKSEEVNGTLQWVPPQVGTSVRSNALGEFVIFTNSPLILHGPPLNEEDHEKFPHVCLGLDREAARKLYRASFIGTRIALSHITIERSTTSERKPASETSPTSVVPATDAVQSPSPGQP